MKTFAKLIATSLCIVGLAAGCEKSTVQGDAGKKLTLVKPLDQSIVRGETEKVSVVVTRKNFEGPVMVRFDDLPRGVSLVDTATSINGNENEKVFVLKASTDADLVKNHTATVTATGPDSMSVTEKFEITIKDKKA